MSKIKFYALAFVLAFAFVGCDKGENSAQNSQNSVNSNANSAANSVNSVQNSTQDLSKYRQMYAKPTSEWTKPELDPSVEKEWQEFAPRPQNAPFPKDNEFAPIKAFLGRTLFNEPRLSKSGQFACENCHHKEMASSDGLPRALGHDGQIGRRNSPSTQMAGFFDELFWDGRAASLEEQALGPITDPVEMANTLANAEKAIKNIPEYYLLFVAAFGDEALKREWAQFYPQVMASKPQEIVTSLAQESTQIAIIPNNEQKFTLQGVEDLASLPPQELANLQEQADAIYGTKAYNRFLSAPNGKSITGVAAPKVPQNLINAAKKLITIENIAKALATFERSFGIARQTRFDDFLRGDYAALSDKELYGLDIFRNKGRCANCHYGFLLSDKKFHNIGLDFYGRDLQDLGRYEVTKNPADIGAFKTPSLVNVAKTAPYMHNGISPNLTGVIQLFNNGVEVPAVNDANLTAIAQRDGANVAGDNKIVAQKKLVVDKDGKILKPTKSPLIHPLNLSADEIEALEAFLRTL